jgi:UDP:flavonoid glycosyltransferase YjiC (YdhE family)
MEPLDSPTRLLWGDVTLVPSCEELEPLPPPPPGRWPASHIGPLYWDPPVEIEEPPKPAGAARVYVTVGGGSMISRRLLTRVLDAVTQPGKVVFASVGAAPPAGLAVPENLHLGGFTGLTQPLRWCDLVISHGGYSSVIAAHLHGRPQVILPLMSEHEANGRQMVERPGCGLLVRRTRSDERTRRLRFVNRATGESEDPLPTAEDLRTTVEAVLADAGARGRAEAISRSLRRAREEADLDALLELAAS